MATSHSGRPRIDHLRTNPFKVAHVARCDGGPARHCDPSNLYVANLDAPTQPAAVGGDASRRLRGGFVEWDHPALEILFKRLAESLLQQSSAPSGGKKLQPKANFKNGDRRGPDGFRGLRIEPSHDERIRLSL